MSMINKEVSNFTVQAYQDNNFRAVSKDDILGKWSVFFFYPADFTFVCPTELEDLANKYDDFKAAGCEIYSVSTDTHFVHKAWHDASDRIKRFSTRCWQTRRMHFPSTLMFSSRRTAWQSAEALS